MNRFAHPLWLVGFRPFFALTCLAGLTLPALWALIYTGVAAAPAQPFSMFQWHAHEMFFGFGWALLGGFLLTASKNWVGSRGYHGGALAFLAAAWLFERAGMWYGGAWPPLLFRLSNNLFLAAIVVMLMATLIRHRERDSYRDNYFFLLILPLFPLAKYLLLSVEGFQLGANMAVGLFRVAFLVMLERTVGTFMKGAFQASLPRRPGLDLSIKSLALVLVGAGLMPTQLAGGLGALLALLLAARFATWYPHKALRRLDIGVMYLGYFAIVAQLLLESFTAFAQPAWVGSVSVHAFTFGAMGLIAPAMIVRISKGHTGRKVAFDAGDKTALWLMIAALLLRLVAPQLFPAAYALWIVLAAVCWSACFGLLGWRYIPYHWQPRVDGKEH